MANRLFKNHATTTLAANISSGATSLTVATGDGAKFPSPSGSQFFLFTLESGTTREICKCTSRSGDTFSVIVRAQEGTAATSWVTGNTVELRWTADSAQHARYDDEALGVATQSFRGLSLRVHPDNSLRNSQVMLVRADAIVMSDGAEATDWDRLTADITASGAAGLDTGSEQSSTWYEIYAIRKSSDGTKNVLLHRSRDYFLDEDAFAGEDGQHLLRDAAARTKLGQGFKVDTTGKCEFIDVKLVRIGSPVGNYWYTIESDSGGVPSGTVLATSDKYDAARLPTSALTVRMPFRNPATLTAATQVHLVLQADFSISGTNHIAWRADTTAATYANGAKAAYDGTTWTTDTDDDMTFKAYITRNDISVTMPSGYDQRCLIGYVCNDASGNFKPFTQYEREIAHSASTTSWRFGAAQSSSVPLFFDLLLFLPFKPCVAYFGTAAPSAAATLGFAPIHATDFSSGAPADFAQVLYTMGTVKGMLNEYNAIYWTTNTGTHDLFVMGLRI